MSRRTNVDSDAPADSPYVSPYLQLPQRTLDDVLQQRTRRTRGDHAHGTLDERDGEKQDSADARR